MGFLGVRAVMAGLVPATSIGRLIVLGAEVTGTRPVTTKALRWVPGTPRGTRTSCVVVAEASTSAWSRFHVETLGMAADLGEVGGGERSLQVARRDAARSGEQHRQAARGAGAGDDLAAEGGDG